MKEREKLFTATLVLTLSIFFTVFVSYTNNLFGVKDFFVGSRLEEEKISDNEIETEEISSEVFEFAEQIKSLYFEGKYAMIYRMGNRNMTEKGSCEAFEEACQKAGKLLRDQSMYSVSEASRSLDKSEYKIKYETSVDGLIVYLKKESGELKVSGIQKTG